MIVALAVIWVFFNMLSDGAFITPRNLWNLSVQSSSVAIMATGMVLIIVSRNIDLSVGAMLGFIGYTMAMVQADWIPDALGLGLDQPYTWIIALLIGVALGALIGTIQGFLVAYGGVPSFIVTLGGLLVWRGLIFRYAQGQTMAPLDKIFQLLGGGPKGALGEQLSWLVGAIACVAIVYMLWTGRRRRRRYDFPVRPMWAEVLIGTIGCAVVLAAVWGANSYLWPPQLASDAGFATPPPVGIAIPVMIKTRRPVLRRITSKSVFTNAL
jgi:D-xylose transport system permease protein